MVDSTQDPSDFDTLTIDKVITRTDGDLGDAQALLVIGRVRRIAGLSPKFPTDIWVNISLVDGAEESDVYDKYINDTDTDTVPPYESISELASVQYQRGNDSPNLDSPYLNNQQTSYYGVECHEGESIWVACFYVSEHDRWAKWEDSSIDLSLLWGKFINDADGVHGLRIKAFVTENTSKKNPEQFHPWWVDNAGTEIEPKPIAIETLSKTFHVSQIETTYLFNMGILMVHGIGPHRIRETLVRFGEPFVKFWTDCFESFNKLTKQSLSLSTRREIASRAEKGALRNRSDNEGFTKVIDNLLKQDSKLIGSSQERDEDIQVVGAGLRVRDTILPQDPDSDPTSTLLRLSLLGKQGRVREAHVLLSEGWWTEKTLYPGTKELFNWIVDALPKIFRMHVTGTLKPELDGIWDAKFIGKIVSILVFMIRLILLIPKLAAILLLQPVLLLVTLFCLIPVARLQLLASKTIEILMQTVGQSYALKTSPLRQNAIVRQVEKKLDWLSDKCEQLVVISHSQGAEVVRLMFQRKPRPKLARWITFGAGIRPLVLLDNEVKDEPIDAVLSLLFRVSSIIVALLAIFAFMQIMLTEDYSTFSNYISVLYLYKILFGAWLVCFIWSMILLLASTVPVPNLRTRRSILNFWHDYTASHDPVPGGSTLSPYKEDFDRLGVTPKWKVIFNKRSVSRDHTAYFENVEGFVAPIGIDVLQLLGFPIKQEQTNTVLEEAQARRAKYTWLRLAWRYCWACFTSIALLVAAIISFPDWHMTIKPVFESSGEFFNMLRALWSSGLLRQVIVDLLPVLLPSIIVYWLVRQFYIMRKLKQSEQQLYQSLADGALF